jgi:general secretion pathway protein D
MRSVARRRSELSAKLTPTVLLVALSQIAVVGTSPTLRAAGREGSSAGFTQPAIAAPQQPTTREEAELMLREARSAIAQGRLDEAEKILSRVENAHVNFSVFHVGPSPASVRRELNHARHMTKPGVKTSNQNAAGDNGHLPFARSSNGQQKSVEDPFATRNPTSEPKAGALGAPDANRPILGTGAAGLVASNNTAAGQPSTLGGYSVTPASVGNNPFRAAGFGAPSDAPRTRTPSDDPYASRPLPDAPLPTRASSSHYENSNPSGSVLPERSAENAAAGDAAVKGQQPKQQATANLAAARKALAAGDIEQAEKLMQAANNLRVPESAYLPDEDRPSLVAWEIARAKQQGQAGQSTRASQPAIERLPATVASRYEVEPATHPSAVSQPNRQATDTMPAAYRLEDERPKQEPETLAMPPASNRVTSTPSASLGPPSNAVASAPASESPAIHLAHEGPRLLPTPPLAGESYRIAAVPNAPATTPQTENLPPPAAGAPTVEPTKPPMAEAAPAAPAKASLIDAADAEQQALARQLSAEIGKRQSESQRLQEKDPERAIATLHEAQQLVNDSKLPESTRRELLSRIEITLGKAEKYSNDHKSQIALDKQNAAVLGDRDRDQEMKLKLQQKIAEMVDEFNRLRDERRYAEMEIIARRLNELAPDNPVAQQVWLNAKFIRREMMNRQLADNKERSVWDQLNSVEESAVNPVAKDGNELVYDEKRWNDFVKGRKGSKDRVQRRTERELEIERRLKTPVQLKYQDTPLSEVMSGLSELTGVNIHLDPRGLTQEGVNSDTPVTINLTKEISLKSALNLILEPLHLSYVINDEVLKITSEQLRDGQIYPQTYNVADLVTPIPNFVPSNNIGLQGLINDSMAAAGHGKPGFASTGPTVLVNDRGQKAGAGANSGVLAQQFNAAPANGLSPSTVPIGAGPGGMGAGANADFDSLIDLIVSTVSTETWAENGGGEAEIRPFPTNLSLVISQTQAVHEEIADLLQQLRRLQDLQVTIEVRFIRLNDSFFERIGIDFDMNIKDNPASTTNSSQFQPTDPNGKSNTVGLLQPAGVNTFPNFTSDLSIPFRQDSFNLTQVVPFGGPVGGGANFGFAILSDIEAYFLIEAAQGDRRTNVLNAPKVTLFNGQQAFVADTTQRPFVVGVIPVVGEFAAAQQPVIVVLNEGTMMTIQAVVSEDRRYVRMTIVPFFTQIGNVDTFTFEGSSSTTSSSSSATDNTDAGKSAKNDQSNADTHTGVTVQLPSFSFVSVVTTVSVPDGGTVLLGGIKRLSEGRNEFGVPLLSKLPYVNRLFRNVAIGRETDSLMMMVTPRIIIQEEEEERLGIAAPQ